MIDPEDLAAFQAAVAGAQPLPTLNHAQLSRPKPPPVPRPRTEAPPEKEKKPASPWPAHWHHEDAAARAARNRPFDPELAAFHAAMAGVHPLPESNRVTLGSRSPAPKPKQFIADEQAALHESLHGLIGLQDRLEGGDEPQYLRHGVAQNVLRDLRRGRWVIQGEIDLHGLNRDQARTQLAHFLAECLHEGRRCIRVIHGKGLGSPQKLSVLRQLVRGWLMQRSEILAYCQAKPHDGGEGALIVLLRAPRSNK